MEEAKKHLEKAVAESSASEYEKGNILYLAENFADEKVKTQSFPFKETYAFLYGRHKDVLHQLELYLKDPEGYDD